MLRGEGNGNGEKTTIGLTSTKTTCMARAAHFFVDFFAVVLHDYNVKLSESSWLYVLWRKCVRVPFHCRSFSPWWTLAFLILSSQVQNFMLLLRWSVALLFLFLCLSLYSKFVDMTINLSLILNTDTETFSAFRFRRF